ncbi:MAG: hypothetical protein ACR2I2_19985 [Bryobacteraceae bacterium]
MDAHIGANESDPPTESFATEFGDERDLLGMFGSGAIELLAREMTADQSVERFGAAQTGTTDFDQDGVQDEISVGDHRIDHLSGRAWGIRAGSFRRIRRSGRDGFYSGRMRYLPQAVFSSE